MFDEIAASLVDLLVLGVETLLGCDPALLESLGVTDFVKNTITYKVNSN